MLKGTIRIFFLLFVYTISITDTSTAQSSTTITNNMDRAFNVVSDVYSELNYNNSVGDVKMHIHGIYNYEGNQDDPGSVREYAMSGHITFSDGGSTLVRKDTFKRVGQDAITSFYDIGEDHVNVTEANEALSPSEAEKATYMYKSLIFSPNLLMQVMMEDASRNTFIATDGDHHIIRHNDAAGNAYFLFINTKTYFLERIDEPMYNTVIGDYYRTITYSKYNIRDGYQAPGEITISRDSNIIYKLTIDLEEILPRVDYGSMRLSQKKIGEWLYLVPMTKWNSKVVIADLEDYLVVFEPPATPEAGYTLLDNIKKAYPGKEIRYCVISHIHPEHMGGVRPFMEEGITIVTTEANKDYFMHIARNRHMFSKDVREKKFISPKFLFITMNQQEIRVKKRIIQIYLLNKQSHHTSEYLLSYIPNDKILIEDDLVETTNLKERKLNNKEKGLTEFISANKINVKEVVQTTPLQNAPHVFQYDVIKPGSNNMLIKGSKKLLQVFE